MATDPRLSEGDAAHATTTGSGGGEGTNAADARADSTASPRMQIDYATGDTVAFWCMRCGGWIGDASWAEHVKTHSPLVPRD